MSRYLTPTAGKFTQHSYGLVKSGDGMWFAMVPAISGAFFIPIIIGLAASLSLFFLLFLLAFLYPISAWLAYGVGTAKLGTGNYGDDQMYADCLKHYRNTIGDHTQELAKPVMEKVYEHAQVLHKGGGCEWTYSREFSDCKVCKPRLAVLKELAPTNKSINSKDDIEAANQFLAARKEILGA